MRPVRHLTPRYLWHRALFALYRYREPDAPWLTRTSISLLETCLQPTDVGLEFGAGRSTIWFAKRVAALTSVENNPAWYTKVQQMLKDQGLTNVRLHLLERNEQDEDAGEGTPYVRIIDTFGAETLDFALIDAHHRGTCTMKVLDKLKPGGLLIIDNVNWFLPSSTRAPASRSPSQGPANAEWAEFLAVAARWRYLWTSNGVWDTAIWFKPPAQIEQHATQRFRPVA